MSQEKINIAMVGATGIVGEMLLKLLAEREFPVGDLYLIASERSTGTVITFLGKHIRVVTIEDFDFSKVQLAFFAVDSKTSEKYVPIATSKGAVVIDKSTHFRYDDDVPLVVPEVNPETLEFLPARRIIANPNCSTIQLVMVLKPIHDAVGILRVNVSTYQSVSGAGRVGVQELGRETAELLNGKPAVPEVFTHQIAFNCLAQIDEFQENGYTKEEMKLHWETQKILGDPRVQVNATAVRVPVFYGHSEAVHLETEHPIEAKQVEEILSQVDGVTLMTGHEYPSPATDAVDQDSVFVGRVRQDFTHPNGIDLWIVADNIRKGAALNAIQIAELLLSRGLI